MRAIFLVLLIVNVAFFVQQYFFKQPDQITSPGGKLDQRDGKNNLQLLSEINGENPLPKKPAQSHLSVVANGAGQDGESLCTMIGPYEQLLQAEYTVEQLAALSVVAHITPIEIHDGESFWVYLKPEMSEKEAVRRLYELQKKNIESHIITKGELTNGISFGRFADYAVAEMKLSEVNAQGYEAAIKRLPKTIQETWVVLDSDSAERVDDSVWATLLAKQIGLEKRQNFCLGVASQKMFQ